MSGQARAVMEWNGMGWWTQLSIHYTGLAIVLFPLLMRVLGKVPKVLYRVQARNHHVDLFSLQIYSKASGPDLAGRKVHVPKVPKLKPHRGLYARSHYGPFLARFCHGERSYRPE